MRIRAQRWGREILAALVLTLAAAVLLLASIESAPTTGGSSAAGPTSGLDARK